MADEKTPVAAKREPRTIRHNLFEYEPLTGGSAIAFRGDTVDLLPKDVARGEKHDAFTAAPGVLPMPVGVLPQYPVEAVLAEQDAWMASATVPEIVAAVQAHPEILQLVLDSEARRAGGARKTLLDQLAATAMVA